MVGTSFGVNVILHTPTCFSSLPLFFLSVLVRPSVCMSVLSTSFPKTSHRIDNVAGEEYQIDFCHAVCLEKMPDVDKSRSDRRP